MCHSFFPTEGVLELTSHDTGRGSWSFRHDDPDQVFVGQ
jgi:hypothetical protein